MLEYIDLGVKWEHLIIGHTHRLSSKWGYHFSFKHLMYSHLVELLWPMTWGKASLRWNNIPWVVVLILLMWLNLCGLLKVDVVHQGLGAPLGVWVHLPTWVSFARKSTCVSKMTIMRLNIEFAKGYVWMVSCFLVFNHHCVETWWCRDCSRCEWVAISYI